MTYYSKDRRFLQIFTKHGNKVILRACFRRQTSSTYCARPQIRDVRSNSFYFFKAWDRLLKDFVNLTMIACFERELNFIFKNFNTHQSHSVVAPRTKNKNFT